MNYQLMIDVPGLPETTNQVLALGLRERMRAKRAWKHAVWGLTAGHRPPKAIDMVELICIRCSSGSIDTDGLVSSFKYLIDGLVESRVLVDDQFVNVGFPQYHWSFTGPNEGHSIILIRELNLAERDLRFAEMKARLQPLRLERFCQQLRAA